VVAEASKEFDTYMKETLGATEADVAWREDIRYDRFGVSDRGKNSAFHSAQSQERHLRPARRNTKDPESEAEESSDTDDDANGDDDDDDDDDDEEEKALPRIRDAYGSIAKGKSVGVGSSRDEGVTVSSQMQMEEFENFKRFQEMMKKERPKY